jgi:hypothetical protein
MQSPETSDVTMQRWGGLGSLLMVAGFLVAPLIYLTGNLRDPMGPLAYSVADLLYGPLWGAGLVTAVFALRERFAPHAPRRTSLALLAAALAAGAFVAVACIRAANRHYHLVHPELHLESSGWVLVVWTTLVAGMIGAAWHLLGWALVLLGSAGWTSRRLPRALCLLFLVAGAVSLLEYQFPDVEGAAVLLGIGWAFWLGLLMWKPGSGRTRSPEDRQSTPT